MASFVTKDMLVGNKKGNEASRQARSDSALEEDVLGRKSFLACSGAFVPPQQLHSSTAVAAAWAGIHFRWSVQAKQSDGLQRSWL